MSVYALLSDTQRSQLLWAAGTLLQDADRLAAWETPQLAAVGARLHAIAAARLDPDVAGTKGAADFAGPLHQDPTNAALRSAELLEHCGPLAGMGWLAEVHCALYPESAMGAAGPGRFRDEDALASIVAEWERRAVVSAYQSREETLILLLCQYVDLLQLRPFPHGNGLTAGIHLEAGLRAMGIARVWSGLYAVCQALAASGTPHYCLSGPLSGGDVARFLAETLRMAQAHARRFSDLLAPRALRDRLQGYLTLARVSTASPLKGLALDALNPLMLVYALAPYERGEFKAATGLPPRSADRVLAACLAAELLTSPSSKGKLELSYAPSLWNVFFPGMWPEGEAWFNQSRP